MASETPRTRRFVFYDETSERPVCDKEFQKLPVGVQDSLLAMMATWERSEDLGTGLKPFTGNRKAKGLYELRHSSAGDAFRVLFLIDGSCAVALVAFKKKSSVGGQTPPKFLKRAIARKVRYEGDR